MIKNVKNWLVIDQECMVHAQQSPKTYPKILDEFVSNRTTKYWSAGNRD